MKIYTQRIERPEQLGDLSTHHCSDDKEIASLALSFDTRQKSRFRAKLASGEDIGVDLPRNDVLKSGALIATDEGELLKIVAAPQPVYKVTADDASNNPQFDLMRAAYHLGNRHVPLMLEPDALYFEPDHVLGAMVEGLGLVVTETMQGFEPETGAYQHHGSGSVQHQHQHEHAHTEQHQHSHERPHSHEHSHSHAH